ATPNVVRAIAELPFVRRMQPVAHSARRLPKPTETALALPRTNTPSFYGPSYDQLSQIGIVAAHNAGFTGTGVVIGILDTGFRRPHVCFNDPSTGSHPLNVVAEFDFVDNDANTAPQPGDPPDQHDHGTWVLGTLGAYKPGYLVGAAYNASFVLAKTEDTTQ